MDWELFLSPYKQAIDELKIKLRGYREQYEMCGDHSPIEFVTGRVKPVTSILDKARRKKVPMDRLASDIQDIAGVRVMCQFVGDIYKVIALLKSRRDFQIIEERDYINEKKESGYRSYHLVINYPVQTITGEKIILVEIQVRTLAMNFWATIEHSLNYKYEGRIPKDIKDRLQRAAEAAFLLDEEMSEIRGEIQIAHKHFVLKNSNDKSTP
ncbi:GTP pyrophosphokinase family protein [Pullulanibacillus sp. KACC 23026]|uniref:GTP pyrophosphokinase n=1 Tax=Pullulanibacillus sp. KACC 23026 TaxID=3028315 RepID=UPI0023B02E59|nr:GTP pyrophosphokinase family protein [Pullulanibacillus sp. KACC 23026]WEG11909.1 GTP pyrophosphokinase family protein [Pullulanibacillus sp. KACC 23026]